MTRQVVFLGNMWAVEGDDHRFLTEEEAVIYAEYLDREAAAKASAAYADYTDAREVSWRADEMLKAARKLEELTLRLHEASPTKQALDVVRAAGQAMLRATIVARQEGAKAREAFEHYAKLAVDLPEYWEAAGGEA
jgi:hypothetical protein